MTVVACLAAPDIVHASTCYGTVGNGRLQAGMQLPAQGSNFTAYSTAGRVLGRTWVHAQVRSVIVDAYGLLAQRMPGKTFVYGETGFAEGGPFEPHRTHQNGLSVDLMVPVLDKHGVSVPIPTAPRLKFGYAIEFDRNGRYLDLRIDFEALAAHLQALSDSARRHGIGIERVIFDPQLSQHLFRTPRGALLARTLPFMRTPAWVRHDEHFHVDFKLPCRPLSAYRAG
jgi:penicillin-insensitive murein endopeptidase